MAKKESSRSKRSASGKSPKKKPSVTVQKKTSKPKDKSASKICKKASQGPPSKSIAKERPAAAFKKMTDFLIRTNQIPDGTWPTITIKDIKIAIVFLQRWPHNYRIIRKASCVEQSENSERFFGFDVVRFVAMSDRAKAIVFAAADARDRPYEYIRKSYELCYLSTGEWEDDEKCKRWPDDCGAAIDKMTDEDREIIDRGCEELEGLIIRLRNDATPRAHVDSGQNKATVQVFGDNYPPRSAPMPLTEIVRRYRNYEGARAKDYKDELERNHGLKRHSTKLWSVRLDTLDAATRQRMADPKKAYFGNY
jgi:hypothetical protein